MKEVIGKVLDYDGYSGKIKYNDNLYLLLDNNVINNDISKDNMVSFIPEEVNGILIARFVKKIGKDK